MQHRSRSGHRSNLLTVAAAGLLASGVGLVGVALAGQASPAALSAPTAAGAASRTSPPAAAASGAGQLLDPADEIAQERVVRRDAALQHASELSSETSRRAAREAASKAARAAQDVAPPVRVVLPSLGVDSSLVPLGLTRSGQIEAPTRYDRAGWFADGVRPGQSGAAVIAGHVDSTEGPGVFYRLADLEPGAQILVEREDGSTATFSVDRLASFPKDDFPTLEVYATNGQELRLITCGGDFDDGHYRDNIVVFASLVQPA